MLKIAYASGINGEFGYLGGLPWGRPLKGDLQEFMRFTADCVLLMGGDTFRSLSTRLRNLPHVVISRDPEVHTIDGSQPNLQYTYLDVSIIDRIRHVYPDKDICVIGGASIIEYFYKYADSVLHTLIFSTWGIEGYTPLDKEVYIDKTLTLDHVKYPISIKRGKERGYNYLVRIYNKC